jgi:hypothetical protein
MAFPTSFTSGVDYNTTGNANGSSISLTKPSGVVDGDYLFLFFQNQTGGGTITPPTGWTSAGITITSRTAQLYYKYIPSAAAETATSYTVSVSVTARMVGEIFRVSGVNTTTPIDVKSAAETAGGAGAVNIASLTASAAGNFAMVFPYSNGAISGTNYSYANGFTDSGIDGVANPGGTRSDVGMAFKLLTAAGAVGTTTVTGFAGTPNGFMVVLNPVPNNNPTATATFTGAGSFTALAAPGYPVAAAFAGSGAFSATTGSNATATALFAGSGALSATTTTGATVAAAFSGTGAFKALRPVDVWVNTQPMYVAHRGGSADWDESTMYAYDRAAAWNASVALEVSIWKSADGVWVVNHDNDPSITGTWANPGSGTITTRNWTGDLQNIVSSAHGSPMIRLVDVLAKYGSTRIIVIDNKAAKDLSTTTVGLSFLATMNQYGGNQRIILKSYYTGVDMWPFARANGYWTWGYYYQSDVANIPSTAANWDILGMEYGATTGWDAVVATGKPFWAHILPSAASKVTADAHTVKSNGYMVSGVMEVIPQTGTIAAFGGTGALTATAVPAYAISAPLGGTGNLAAQAAPGFAAVAAMIGSGSFTAALKQGYSANAPMGGTGNFTATAGNQFVANALFGGTGGFVTAVIQKYAVSAFYGATGNLVFTVSGGSAYGVFVWDGAALIPATIAGVWDGTSLVPATLTGIV